MTPEERARADEITEEISRQSRERRQGPVTIPGISPKPPSPTIRIVSQEQPAKSGNGIRYALIFILVLTLHAAGFMAYTRHMETKEREMQEAAAAAIRDAAEAGERARAEAERLTAAFTSQQAQLRPQISAGSSITLTNPKIEYNVYKEPTPARRQVVIQSPQPVEEVQPDRSREHLSIAAAYLSLKGIYARSVSIERISGWDGRYRTEFEVPRNNYTTGTNSPKPKRYEVITEEKGGKITALEYTTKGYY